MAKKSTKKKVKKYPTQWREVSRFLRKFDVYPAAPGTFRVIPIYEVTYARRYDPRDRHLQHERRLIEGTEVSTILRKLDVSDKELSLHDLTMAGLSGIDALVKRYDWTLWREEERAKIKRRKQEARRKEKKKSDEDRRREALKSANHQKEVLQMVNSRQFVRSVDA